MRVLVSGHNGYIGSVLVPVLTAAGHEVVGFDTFFYEECTYGPDRQHPAAIRKDIRDVVTDDVFEHPAAGRPLIPHLFRRTGTEAGRMRG